MILTSLVTAAALASGVSAPGQDFPNPKPTEAHQVFTQDAGTWDAAIKMFLGGPDAPPTEYKGTETNELVCGGLFLRTAFRGKMGDRDFEGHGLLGYDAKNNEYVGTWVDNFTSTPSALKGKYDAAKKTMTTMVTATTETGEEMTQKQVTTYPDDKTRKFEIFLALPNGELKLMEMTLTKRG
jgi:hypothetical protein